jgi:hypothetical protein
MAQGGGTRVDGLDDGLAAALAFVTGKVGA